MGPPERKGFLEQIRSKETWMRVWDLMARHDPKSDSAKAIRKDVLVFGWLPFVICLLKRWSRFFRQQRAVLKWWAAPVHIAFFTPGSVLK
jgi:hypothetical protein